MLDIWTIEGNNLVHFRVTQCHKYLLLICINTVCMCFPQAPFNIAAKWQRYYWQWERRRREVLHTLLLRLPWGGAALQVLRSHCLHSYYNECLCHVQYLYVLLRLDGTTCCFPPQIPFPGNQVWEAGTTRWDRPPTSLSCPGGGSLWGKSGTGVLSMWYGIVWNNLQM